MSPNAKENPRQEGHSGDPPEMKASDSTSALGPELLLLGLLLLVNEVGHPIFSF